MRRKLLLVYDGSKSDDALLADLEQGGFELARAATVEAAAAALRDQPIALVLVCAAAPLAVVDELAAAVKKARPGVPVLAIRDRNGAEPEARDGVGVLRRPLLPDALVRSVEVVLGLKKK